MRIGLDFGTTNSSAAVYDGQAVRLFRIGPSARDPAVVRSALYITRDHTIHIGQDAINIYYEQNTGRPSRMMRRYVGEIEMTFGDVGTLKGYPVRASNYFQEVYVMVDELTPGRLVHSLKSGLLGGGSPTYVFDCRLSLEGLIALYLRELRLRVEQESGNSVNHVVLGRPVSFAGAETEGDNARCEARLLQAAAEAGFSDVAFELEPVAAALDYELTVDRPENVFVFDLGGGTLDVTVMRVGESGRQRVLATGGAGLGGEVFDQQVIGGLLLEHLGRGSTWGDRAMPLPGHYTESLVDWQTIPSLVQPDTLRFLHEAQLTGNHPSRIRALESLLVNNYAMRMIDAVERCKIALSTLSFDVIRLTGEDLDIWQPIARSQFEFLIAGAIDQIRACVIDTIAQSGLRASEIDAVIQTGGSAQTPCFVEMLGNIFGPEKIVGTEAFTTVAAGLAVRGAQMDGRL